MYILCLPVGTGRVVSVSVFSFSMNNQDYCTISVFHKYFASLNVYYMSSRRHRKGHIGVSSFLINLWFYENILSV